MDGERPYAEESSLRMLSRLAGACATQSVLAVGHHRTASGGAADPGDCRGGGGCDRADARAQRPIRGSTAREALVHVAQSPELLVGVMVLLDELSSLSRKMIREVLVGQQAPHRVGHRLFADRHDQRMLSVTDELVHPWQV